MRRVLTGVVLVAWLVPVVGHAQIPVTDVAALAQWFNQVRLVTDTLDIMRAEYDTMQRISRGYGGSLIQFRVPGVVTANHDISRYLYAARLLEGLNAGDPYGARYTQVMRVLLRPGGVFDDLPTAARRILEASYAGIEVTDSVATIGIHEAALSRGYLTRIAALIEHLQADVTNPGREYHEPTAIADKIAIAGLINARQNQNSNQIESSILEQLLAKNMRLRNGAAAHANMVITTMKDGGDLSSSVVSGATSALENWRLP